MEILKHFRELTLSLDQKLALEKLELFLTSPIQVFMLKGYAGSGKTTILKGLIEYLAHSEKDFALMAPTGRAAKVIREKTGQEAFTIHKSIYSYDEMEEIDNADIEGGKSFYYSYKIRNNDNANKIYIIDEASMVSDAKSEGEFFRFGSGHLLSDLVSYTRITSPSSTAKIIFVGDPCQLPPVGEHTSRAFDATYLKEKFNVSSEWTELKEIKRQDADSGIIATSAKIRKCVSSGYFNDFDLRENGNDIFNPRADEFLSIYTEAKSPKIIIAYKNKTCLAVNSAIREQKYSDTRSIPPAPARAVCARASPRNHASRRASAPNPDNAPPLRAKDAAPFRSKRSVDHKRTAFRERARSRIGAARNLRTRKPR